MNNAIAIVSAGKVLFRGAHDAILFFRRIRSMETVQYEAQELVCILLAVARQLTAILPTTLQHMNSSVAFMLLLPKEVRENVIHGAGRASFTLAVFFTVPLSQIIRPDNWVVNYGL